MSSLLAIAAQLDGGGAEESPAVSPQKLPSALVDTDPIEGVAEEAGAVGEPFHASKKSNTLKKYYQKLF